jgi:hypothetical protein
MRQQLVPEDDDRSAASKPRRQPRMVLSVRRRSATVRFKVTLSSGHP